MQLLMRLCGINLVYVGNWAEHAAEQAVELGMLGKSYLQAENNKVSALRQTGFFLLLAAGHFCVTALNRSVN